MVFEHGTERLESPSLGAVAVTPSDTQDLEDFSRGLYLGVGGDVKVTMYDGTIVLRKNMIAGMIHPICVKRVWSTGTTATDIVAEL
jgi:hypothetical protein